jgi:hypothetical protein
VQAASVARSNILPSRSPKLSDCSFASWTASRWSLSVAAIAQIDPPPTQDPVHHGDGAGLDKLLANVCL